VITKTNFGVDNNMIGSAIQEKRKAAGLTQAQLADLLGVSAPAVNRWEKNLCFPDATLLAPLARCLKTDINSLFSFYESLSDKERELIVNHASDLLLRKSDEEAFSYITEALRANLSDGELYLMMADRLYGFHTVVKASRPTAYLAEAAEYYERALSLLPEKRNIILPSLISIYAASGDAEKAEAVWQQLPEDVYSKKWQHAEMQYHLGKYTEAATEAKELVLRDVIDLSLHISALENILIHAGDPTLAEVAGQKATKLRELFELWLGFDTTELVIKAIENKDANGEIEQLCKLVSSDRIDDPISSCPLFAEVVLGGKPRGEGTTADAMTDLKNTIAKLD
jgi:transcriptional regulator with XRE-family HTH domain